MQPAGGDRFALWLSAAEREGLAIRHRIGATHVLRPFDGNIRRQRSGAQGSIHLRFIATFKLPFKFSPEYPVSRGRNLRPRNRERERAWGRQETSVGRGKFGGANNG
jgi:hypothetical protein